jgi:glutathione S-transferase
MAFLRESAANPERVMKLYYLKGACSLASHIALYETGLKFEVSAIDRATRKTSEGDAFDEINTKGYAPTLRLDSGELLTENVAVLQYVADLAPASKLAPPNGTLARYRLIEWLAYINSEVHKAVSPLFNPAATDDVKTFARNYVTKRTDWLEKHFGKGPFLMGETFTVADCYLFVVFGWFARVGLDQSKWPTLKAFHQRVAARPSAQSAMKAEGLS